MLFKQERRDILIRFFRSGVPLFLASFTPSGWAFSKRNKDKQGVAMTLPEPNIKGTLAVEQAISQRRTIRAFIPEPLGLNLLSQLLWAMHGVTDKGGLKRAAPSAGALYPMDVYVVAGKGSVARIDAGVYHYEPGGHRLSLVASGDLREVLAKASLSQMWMARAPANMVITAEYERATVKYRKRGFRYAMIEAGHIGQNLFLQAEALGLKAGIVGAFHDKDIIRVLKLPSSHEPLLIMPVGYQV